MNAQELEHVHVLIVDDDRDMRVILKSFLKDMGIHHVTEASDSRHALQIVQSAFRPIDLILCDWNMPGLSGIEFVEEVALAGHHPQCLMISGRGDTDSVLVARAAGVSGYIRKPFDPEHLEARVLQALQCKTS